MRQKPDKQRDQARSTATVTGTLAHFSFRNADTGFAVVRVELDAREGPTRPVRATWSSSRPCSTCTGGA